jgi:hypothetical protein
MANTVSLVSTFLALIDEAYKAESKTAMLDALTQSPSFLNANEVKVLKLSLVGLGNYSRTTGYPAGDLIAAWETMTLAAERGRAFSLDRMDNEEMLGLALGAIIREWMKMHVAPELDAYRFAKYAAAAATANVVAAGATLTKATVLDAIDAAKAALRADEVPLDGMKLFVSDSVMGFLEGAVSRTLSNENGVDRRVTTLDGMQLIEVPQTRFYTAITLNAGASSDAGGFIKNASTGKDINFLMVRPDAVLQPVKLNQVKYFDPDTNQSADAHLWQYRLYHDAFVYENKVNGIYLHMKA